MQTHKFSIEDFRAIDPEGGKGGRWLCPTDACRAYTDPPRHRAVSMVMETGLWNCKRCQARGQLIENWKAPDHRSFKERAQERSRREQEAIRSKISMPRIEELCPEIDDDTAHTVKYRTGTTRPIADVPVAVQFLQSRGFSPHELNLLHYYGVRYAHDFGRTVPDRNDPNKKMWPGRPSIVFPIRDGNKKLVAVQGRFIAPMRGTKTLTFGPRALGVFMAFFDWPDSKRAGGQIALCEAPLDALALAVRGHHALALCGCDNLPDWITKTAHGGRFIVATDADEAGDKASYRLSGVLRSVGATVSRWRPDNGCKDFSEMLTKDVLPWAASQEDSEELADRVRWIRANPDLSWPTIEDSSLEWVVNGSVVEAIETLVSRLRYGGDEAQEAVEMLERVANLFPQSTVVS